MMAVSFNVSSQSARRFGQNSSRPHTAASQTTVMQIRIAQSRLTALAANSFASSGDLFFSDCEYSGMNAAESAPSPNSFRNRFGARKANVNADATSYAPR